MSKLRELTAQTKEQDEKLMEKGKEIMQLDADNDANEQRCKRLYDEIKIYRDQKNQLTSELNTLKIEN